MKDYTKYRIRICQSMHDCAVCGGTIKYGDVYYDGGYGRRAHERCAKPVKDTR